MMTEREGKIFTEKDYRRRLEIIKEAHIGLRIFKFFLNPKSGLKKSPKEKRRLKEFLRSLKIEEKKKIMKALEFYPGWVNLSCRVFGWEKTLEIILYQIRV